MKWLGFPNYRLWAKLMKNIPETHSTKLDIYVFIKIYLFLLMTMLYRCTSKTTQAYKYWFLSYRDFCPGGLTFRCGLFPRSSTAIPSSWCMLTGILNNRQISDSSYNKMAWQWTSLVSDNFYIQLNPIINIIWER